VLAVRQHPDSGKPFVQRNRRVLEYALCFYRKLFAAFRAFPDAPSLEKHRILRAAMLAIYTFGPTAIRDFGESIIRVSIMLNRFGQGLWLGDFHEPSMAERDGCVKYVLAVSFPLHPALAASDRSFAAAGFGGAIESRPETGVVAGRRSR